MVNTELLLKIKQHILEEPKRLDMGGWLTFDYHGSYRPSCGTVGCIAGWAVALSVPREQAHIPGVSTESRARGFLKIDDEEAEVLFYVGGWDGDLFDAYHASQSHQGRAKVAAEAIDRFILKYGGE